MAQQSDAHSLRQDHAVTEAMNSLEETRVAQPSQFSSDVGDMGVECAVNWRPLFALDYLIKCLTGDYLASPFAEHLKNIELGGGETDFPPLWAGYAATYVVDYPAAEIGRLWICDSHRGLSPLPAQQRTDTRQ